MSSLKMVMVAYNEAIDAEIMGVISHGKAQNYTKIKEAYGKGIASGTHLGDDIWPGRNNILYVACDEEDAKELMARVKELRKSLGKEGIKAFVIPLEEVT